MRKVVTILGLVVSVAACSDSSPTETSRIPQPSAPGLNGGTLGGSGNRGTQSAGTETLSADSVGRGGTLGGSGN